MSVLYCSISVNSVNQMILQYIGLRGDMDMLVLLLLVIIVQWWLLLVDILVTLPMIVVYITIMIIHGKRYGKIILYVHVNYLIIIQLVLPQSVTTRWWHSLSLYPISPHCVLLVVNGGRYLSKLKDTVIVELGKYLLSHVHQEYIYYSIY